LQSTASAIRARSTLTTCRQEFNARTSIYTPGIPIPARVTVRPDRSFHFETRTPPAAILLLRAAGVKEIRGKLRGAGNPPGPTNNRDGARGKEHASHPKEGNAKLGTVGTVSLKHVFEIASIKRTEKRLAGLSQEAVVKSIVAQAAGMGVVVVP
jgi:large subunit ribosomal protein L11